MQPVLQAAGRKGGLSGGNLPQNAIVRGEIDQIIRTTPTIRRSMKAKPWSENSASLQVAPTSQPRGGRPLRGPYDRRQVTAVGSDSPRLEQQLGQRVVANFFCHRAFSGRWGACGYSRKSGRGFWTFAATLEWVFTAAPRLTGQVVS